MNHQTPDTNASICPPALPAVRQQNLLSSPLNAQTVKAFFSVTGGSSLYCLSAVLVAYGIIRVLTPVLERSDTLRDALPSLLTLHGYEVALLGVLLLIALRKVVDDAISLAILLALFLVGTSIALGAVADRAITASLYLGTGGILLAFLKIFAVRRFAGIPLTQWAVLAIMGLMTCNYLGPALMARAVSLHAADEPARRSLWLLLCLGMLASALMIWIQAIQSETEQKRSAVPFFNSPAMAYLLAAIITAASGVHQYTMAYAFTLERVLMDYVPITAVTCLLIIEILWCVNRRLTIVEAGLASIPLFLTMYAIYQRSVLSTGAFGISLIGYPPFVLALTGLAMAALAFYRKRRLLWLPVCGYVLGVILTAGFSPDRPHDLNVLTCSLVLISTLLLAGLLKHNLWLCLSAVILIALGLANMDLYPARMTNWKLTESGGLAGVFGLGTMLLYLLFTDKTPRFLRLTGAVCLAAFIFDYLEPSHSVRYLITVTALGALLSVLWVRTRDWVTIIILSLPVFARIFIIAKTLAYWRHVIVGFLLLGAGAVISVFKRASTEKSPAQQAVVKEDLHKF